MRIYLIAMLFIAGLLFAEDYFNLWNQTLSKPENDVISYDVTLWTAALDWNTGIYDSICVFAHSEKINDNTSALVFSRWFIEKNANSGNLLLQDTILLEQGTLINQVKFPAHQFYDYCYLGNYEFNYLYFSSTKNNLTNFYRVKHLTGGNFTQPEVLAENLHGNDSFSASDSMFTYNKYGKVFLKDFTTNTFTVIDSNNCQNPQIFIDGDYHYLTWEKVIGDTVKTFYKDYHVYDHTWCVIKQFYSGDVRNLRLCHPHCIWESGAGNNMKTFYSGYDTFPPSYVIQVAGNPRHYQTIDWYGDHYSYQTGDGDSSHVFLFCFNFFNLPACKQPSIKLVAVEGCYGYAPWTYLQKVDGSYQLKSKMLYLPEVGIHDTDKDKKQSVLINSYPNPFNNSTNISYHLPKSGLTSISVFNSSGQLVKDLLKQVLPAGEHGIQLKADNLNSGVYYLRISNAGIERCHKLLLIK